MEDQITNASRDEARCQQSENVHHQSRFNLHLKKKILIVNLILDRGIIS